MSEGYEVAGENMEGTCDSCDGPVNRWGPVGSDTEGNEICGRCVASFHRDHELCGLCEGEGELPDDSTCPLCNGAGYVAREET